MKRYRSYFRTALAGMLSAAMLLGCTGTAALAVKDRSTALGTAAGDMAETAAPSQAASRDTDGANVSAVTRQAFVELLYEAVVGNESVQVSPAAFTDVADSFAVDWAADKGIISGNGAGQFLPDQAVTREQAAVMLLNAAKALDRGPQGAWAVWIPYDDGAAISDWAAEGVMWNVIEQDIPVGTDNLFQPQGTLTAEQAAAIISAFIAA